MAAIPSWRDAADTLRRDLDAVVGTRLRALVVYEAHGPASSGDLAGTPDAAAGHEIRHGDLLHTLAVVDDLAFEDLSKLAALTSAWEKRRLALPLLFSPRELARSLDAFPLEFAQMIARHAVAFGTDPLEGLVVARADLRRACETQVKSHLVHLREGYLQSGGDSRKVAELVAASAAPLGALFVNLGRLLDVHRGSPLPALHALEKQFGFDGAGLERILSAASDRGGFKGPEIADAFPAYLDAVERLARLVDEWTL
jgi:hypothetical protein